MQGGIEPSEARFIYAFCELYIEPPIFLDWRYSNYSLDYEDVAVQYGVELDDLKNWNPTLPTNCTLSSDARYCVLLANEEPPEVTEYCAQYAPVESGTTATTSRPLTGWGGISSIDTDWLDEGLSYCVRVLHYRQPGTESICNRCIVANDTEWANDPCTQIETKFGLSRTRSSLGTLL
ncbi:hypothetical protein DL770_004072 [Monosporascus sp. CRB-9-2]|nr:hypothetical protein DL770_004072 [Monosporascus sp. CRB-9-2]